MATFANISGDKLLEARTDMLEVLVGHALMTSDKKAAPHDSVCIVVSGGAFSSVDIHEGRLAKYIAGKDRSCLNSILLKIDLQVIASERRRFSHDERKGQPCRL